MPLLEELWEGTPSNKFILLINKQESKKQQIKVKSTDEALQFAVEYSKRGYDVYFSVGTFSGNSREQAGSAGLKALFIDIDCGPDKPYKTLDECYEALNQWLDKRQFPEPSRIVESGHGLHLYWLLDRHYAHAEWLVVAQLLKQTLALDGFHADPTRTADAASVLRVPGTMNYKNPADPKLVVERYSAEAGFPLDSLKQKLPFTSTPAAIPGAPATAKPQLQVVPKPDTDILQGLYPLGDAPAIADACAQMRHFRDQRGVVPEPYWRAALSVLHRCDDALKYVHEWSSGDPRYDPVETGKKAALTKGPATCKHFDEVNPGGCLNCPYGGKVSSPIQIRPAPMKKTAAAPDWKVNRVGRFTVSDAGIFYDAPADPENNIEPIVARVTDFPLWVVEVRQKAREDYERDKSCLVIRYVDLKGREGTANIDQSEVYEFKTLKAWLANHNLMSGVREIKFLPGYLQACTAHLNRTQGAVKFYENLGWSADGFMLGDRLVTADGVAPAQISNTASPLRKLKETGSFKKWKEAMRLLNAPEFDLHAFCLLAALGSPLLALTDNKSAIVSLAGLSGAGKTLAARIGLSVYGHPETLMQSATSTINATNIHLGHLRHLPFLWDEATMQPLDKIADFIYDVSNGHPKGTATRNRELRETCEWALVPFLTSNKPILEADDSEIHDAHRRRLIELWFDSPMPREIGYELSDCISHNYGVAAPAFLKNVIKLKDKIPGLVRAAADEISRKYGIPDANRFGVWTIAAAGVAGHIGHESGIHFLNTDRIIDAVAKSLMKDVAGEPSLEVQVQMATSEWLAQQSKRVCRWKHGAETSMNVVDDPIARVYCNGDVAIHRKQLVQMWNELRIAKKQAMAWLQPHVKGEAQRVTLAPGTAQVWALVVDAAAVGL